MSERTREAAEFFTNLYVRYPLGLIVCNLPRRHWQRMTEWAIVTPAVVFFSALMQTGGSLGWFVFTYVGFIPGGPRTMKLALYFFVAGIARALSAFIDEPVGDPILTGIDTVILRRVTAARAARARSTREALEGPEVGDRLVEAKAAGFDDADFVVIASRQKPEWTKGTVVAVDGDKWYRLREPVTRDTVNGLRYLYPIAESNDLEVIRRRVDYELPPVSRLPKWWA